MLGYIGRRQGGRRALVVGGGRPKGFDKGWFVEPTLFADVDNHMNIAQEEIFGPVLSLHPLRRRAEALRIANDSDYGLSGSVWTADVERGLDVARRVRTGTYGVNFFGMEFAARSAASSRRASAASSARRACAPTSSRRRSTFPPGPRWRRSSRASAAASRLQAGGRASRPAGPR